MRWGSARDALTRGAEGAGPAPSSTGQSFRAGPGAAGSSAELTDQRSLVVALGRGDERALEECFRRHAAMVRTYVRHFVPADGVDDVVQMVFLELWRSRARLDPERDLEPWLLAVARRRSIDSLRRRHDVVDASALRDLVGDRGEEIAERVVWAMEVRNALGRLPQAQQEAIGLSYYEQLSQREIAERLDVPLGTVKARVARGLARLADELRGSDR
jgi:RNA polymerase sigma factor (sigma-70 family)